MTIEVTTTNIANTSAKESAKNAKQENGERKNFANGRSGNGAITVTTMAAMKIMVDRATATEIHTGRTDARNRRTRKAIGMLPSGSQTNKLLGCDLLTEATMRFGVR